MYQNLTEQLAGFHLSAAQTHGPLRIFPLLSLEADSRDYVTLREALEQGLALISELSEGGSVPELKVVNKSKRPILILAGEELRGAKQNRVLNTTVLIAPESELIVPVSCTEAGRWAYRSREFSESGNMMAPSIKAKMTRSVNASFMHGRSARSDQREVWDEIDKLQLNLEIPSPTSAMADVFESTNQRLENILARFPLLEGQCGIYAMFGGRFAGLDVVSRPDAWKHLHAKIVKSYAMDTLRYPDRRTPEADGVPDLEGLLADVRLRHYNGIGLGEELRLDKPGIAGSALMLENRLIHLSIFEVVEDEPIVERFHRNVNMHR